MKRNTLWAAVSVLMALSLLAGACATPATTPSTIAPTTTPATSAPPTATTATTTPPTIQPTQNPSAPPAEKPKYGGTLNIVGTGDVTNWDPNRLITGYLLTNSSEELWSGDWARGPAGGFGTDETDWGFGDNDLFDLKIGYLAESWKWSTDVANNQGAIVIQVKKGVHFALNPNSEASRLVNGREMTTDDVLYSLKRSIDGSYQDGYIYRTNIELRSANITKTGPNEITIKLPLASLITGITRIIGKVFIVPPEVITKYGDMNKWQNNVGTGPFMITEYVPGSTATLVRNPNYWMKNPVGPGKGDQLPYLDSIKQPIVPDASTRLAAVRTGKIDFIGNLNADDAAGMLKTTPNLVKLVGTSFQGRGTPAMMRTDKAPFNDIRVRKAMMMATDFQSILKDYRGGNGQIVTFPFSKVRGYEELYVGLDDPDFPAAAKDLYTYNPDGAKALLKEAGYPNGFKTSIILSGAAGNAAQVDYYSIIKGMWAKVGIDLSLDLRDATVVSNIQTARSHDALITNTTGPVAVFYVGNPIQGTAQYNLSMIDDPQINAAMTELRLAALTDSHQAMKIFREKIFKYVLPQAFAIPDVIGTYTDVWWPWLKNYSGEITIGYDNNNWPQFIWYDQTLKKSMGY